MQRCSFSRKKARAQASCTLRARLQFDARPDNPSRCTMAVEAPRRLRGPVRCGVLTAPSGSTGPVSWYMSLPSSHRAALHCAALHSPTFLSLLTVVSPRWTSQAASQQKTTRLVVGQWRRSDDGGARRGRWGHAPWRGLRGGGGSSNRDADTAARPPELLRDRCTRWPCLQRLLLFNDGREPLALAPHLLVRSSTSHACPPARSSWPTRRQGAGSLCPSSHAKASQVHWPTSSDDDETIIRRSAQWLTFSSVMLAC